VSPGELWLPNLGVALGAMGVLWLASLALRDASIVDAWWGPGFALLERTIARRRPRYADYAARVPAFFPRPPRPRA
jgi:steroid 5-alpha reductase family enzyme